MVRHTVIAPPAVLQPYVRYFWTLEVDYRITNAFPVRTYVDDSSGILLEYAYDHGTLIPRRSMLYGQTTLPTMNNDNAPFKALGVLFHPFTIRELSGIPARELTNRRIPPDELLRIPLNGLFSAPDTLQHMVQALSGYLINRIPAGGGQDGFIRHYINAIKANPCTISVRQLCHNFHITERQLERKFQEYIGVSPRHYIKLSRFKEALNRIANTTPDKLSDIAYQLNYFDQAHFIKQAKALTGVTPKALQNKLKRPVANIILSSESYNS